MMQNNECAMGQFPRNRTMFKIVRYKKTDPITPPKHLTGLCIDGSWGWKPTGFTDGVEWNSVLWEWGEL